MGGVLSEQMRRLVMHGSTMREVLVLKATGEVNLALDQHSFEFASKFRAEGDVDVEVHRERQMVDQMKIVLQLSKALLGLRLVLLQQTPGVNACVRSADDQIRR